METVFDHNVTEDELKLLFRTPLTRAEYENKVNTDVAYGDLYRLYSLRGNTVIAYAYLYQIESDTIRNAWTLYDR
ncbi:MAG TPA: hypothetical protein VHT73_02520, partial [Thermodesulfobacteriota bacterium]|nr:hypothetical protein [Thermodesulfobacteriota bacterium]